MCIAAVKQNGKYVKNQTKAICVPAISKDISAFAHIVYPTLILINILAHKDPYYYNYVAKSLMTHLFDKQDKYDNNVVKHLTNQQTEIYYKPNNIKAQLHQQSYNKLLNNYYEPCKIKFLFR